MMGTERAEAAADREIVISRSVGAPRELVFEAFTEVRHLSRWWGPEGFSTTTRSFEFRAGGVFDGVDASRVRLEPIRSEPSPRVTHLTYAVHPRLPHPPSPAASHRPSAAQPGG